jgi:indolepyruvate ferredoxin oxidoreductase alpha subunit
MTSLDRKLMSGNEAIALAAHQAGLALGTGYPGTPSTEILEELDALGGRAQWAPNEKVAMEVAIGSAFAGARAMVTMKHVGLNVAADPLFTAAYTGVSGALVVISADDPGLASSQNEQDNRHYAVAAGLPMLEPASSQEAYDFLLAAIDISEKWHIPVLYRITTRVCHSKTIVTPRTNISASPQANFVRDVKGRVMIPAYARQAHRRLRQKLAELSAWGETSPLNQRIDIAGAALGVITSGISFMHAREALGQASFLKLGMTYPLPMELIRSFAASVKRCLVVEEGDPYLADAIRAAGIAVESKAEMFRFGELNVSRVAKLAAGDLTPEPAPPPGKPPQLCPGCPHRTVFEILSRLGCIVSGDIGCYTLGVLPPFNAMDSCVCMGASIGVGLGLRHVLPLQQARRVVSVLGDSTFMHSGMTGLVEMVYNPPATGHVVMILDNDTTAMTGLQDHPGTGRRLNQEPSHKVSIEGIARSIGVEQVDVIDPLADPAAFETLLRERLSGDKLSVIVVRRPCLLAMGKHKRRQPAGPA